jgi:hypothetical protein
MLAWPWKKRQGESEPVENPMPNATVRANAPASPESAKPAAPEAERAKDPRIIAAEVVAEVDLRNRIEKIQSEMDIEAAEEASRKAKSAEADRFENAYRALLAAKAAVKDPSIDDDDVMTARQAVEAEAERRFMTMPAVYADHVWQKIEAFEGILGGELIAGERTDSILLIAIAAIKQDIINLDLFWGCK